jgi:hypothetical protein
MSGKNAFPSSRVLLLNLRTGRRIHRELRPLHKLLYKLQQLSTQHSWRHNTGLPRRGTQNTACPCWPSCLPLFPFWPFMSHSTHLPASTAMTSASDATHHDSLNPKGEEGKGKEAFQSTWWCHGANILPFLPHDPKRRKATLQTLDCHRPYPEHSLSLLAILPSPFPFSLFGLSCPTAHASSQARLRLLLVMPSTMTPKTQKAKREKGRKPSKHLVVLWGQHPPLGQGWLLLQLCLSAPAAHAAARSAGRSV